LNVCRRVRQDILKKKQEEDALEIVKKRDFDETYVISQSEENMEVDDEDVGG
jgi:hypothetical protein